MPGYQEGSAKLIRSNQQMKMFDRESYASFPRASAAFQLERISHSAYPFGASFEVFFTDVNGVPADPGNFEVDIQTADLDMNTHYCTIQSLVNDASLNSYFVGRIELPNFWARYVRASVKSLTNSVYVSVQVTR